MDDLNKPEEIEEMTLEEDTGHEPAVRRESVSPPAPAGCEVAGEVSPKQGASVEETVEMAASRPAGEDAALREASLDFEEPAEEKADDGPMMEASAEEEHAEGFEPAPGLWRKPVVKSLNELRAEAAEEARTAKFEPTPGLWREPVLESLQEQTAAPEEAKFEPTPGLWREPVLESLHEQTAAPEEAKFEPTPGLWREPVLESLHEQTAAPEEAKFEPTPGLWREPVLESLHEQTAAPEEAKFEPTPGLWREPVLESLQEQTAAPEEAKFEPTPGLWREPVLESLHEQTAAPEEAKFEPTPGLWREPVLESLHEQTAAPEEAKFEPTPGLWREPVLESLHEQTAAPEEAKFELTPGLWREPVLESMGEETVPEWQTAGWEPPSEPSLEVLSEFSRESQTRHGGEAVEPRPEPVLEPELLGALEGTSGVEPMHELLEELLALDSGAEGEESALSTDPAIGEEPVGEAPLVELAPEPLPEFAADDFPDSLPEEPETIEALAAQFLEQEVSAPPPPPLAFEPSAQAGNDPFFLAPLEAEEPAEEPVSEPVDEPAAMFTAEEPAAEAAAVLEPEMPAPPQPALEELVAGIDHALESAPAIAAAEPAAPTVHKQYSQLDDYVVFSLAGSDYAVPVRDVAEIGRVPGITRVPNVPDFMRGITNLRGEVVPVINLPGLLGLQDSAPSARGRVLFLQARERVSPTGLMVDEVKGIQRIQSQQLEQVTGLVDDKVTSVLRGVHGRGDRLLNVLDLEQLFGLQEFEQLASR
ncbi:MAG: chemotaxis protein CheW [Bryobacterales bacterium]|nr:chemotaxis protein CheW [Bryobacterales bacterium]